MYNHLVHFLDYNGRLYLYQFRFRQGHSTQQAIISVVEKITSSLGNGDLVIGVFLYLKKAFDTVDYQILLKNYICMVSGVTYYSGVKVTYLIDHSMLLMMECNQKFYPSSMGFHRDRYLVHCCLLFT